MTEQSKVRISKFPFEASSCNGLTMAMEGEGQAKEIPLATAQHVHVQLGSLRDLDPRAGDLSRSRKDPVPSLRRQTTLELLIFVT